MTSSGGCRPRGGLFAQTGEHRGHGVSHQNDENHRVLDVLLFQQCGRYELPTLNPYEPNPDRTENLSTETDRGQEMLLVNSHP